MPMQFAHRARREFDDQGRQRRPREIFDVDDLGRAAVIAVRLLRRSMPGKRRDRLIVRMPLADLIERRGGRQLENVFFLLRDVRKMALRHAEILRQYVTPIFYSSSGLGFFRSNRDSVCAPACGAVAMYFRRKTSAGRAYLQIVESSRDGDQVRQQVIATLGRFDELQASGQPDRLVRSGARFAAKAMVLSAASNDAAIKIAVRRIGPALVFERLWEEIGCRAVVADLAGKRGHKFALERAVFLTVLHRLFVSGSDRAADRWREDYAIAGVEGLDLHHLYRAMAWLGEELPEKEQDGQAHRGSESAKVVVEERLFAHRRDLLTRLDLVFMDTTSLYFEGAGGQTLGQHGYSKDHRPDLRQMILAVLRPVCS